MISNDRIDKGAAEYTRLLRELERLEREQQTLDLRDRVAIDECARKIATLRTSIDRFRLTRRTE